MKLKLWQIFGALLFFAVIISGWQTVQLVNQDAQIVKLELKAALMNQDFCEYTHRENIELREDLAAKDSLFINHCRRGHTWACGLWTEGTE